MDNNLYKHIVLQFDQAQQPKFEEKKNKNYVEFGQHNDYPDYLLNLYNESPKHGGIIKGKCTYIYGKGFEEAGNANTSGESWNDILRKVIKDDELYRGVYFQVIWNRAKQVSEIYHIEFHKVRVSKDLLKFHVKNDWCDLREKAREYDAFNPNNPYGSQILYYKEYNPSSDVYPLPYYFQGLNYIESDIQVSRHILGMAKNQFVGSKLIQLNNGDPIGEEFKGEVERSLLKKFAHHEGQRTVIMFNKSKENSADIQDLGASSLTKEDFTNVNNLIQQEIFACHSITSPVLFGISTAGALGQRNEIRDAYEVFSNTYVNSRQQELETIFTKLRNLKGEQGEFKIVPIEPLKFEFTEAIIAANLTQDEIRALMGKEPLQANQVTSDGSVAVKNEVQVDAAPYVNETPNESLKNLTGRQHQNVMRIVRQFTQGKLTKAQASLMLKNGFGFTDKDVNDFLGIDEDPLTHDEISKFSVDYDNQLFEAFAESGDSINDFEILSEKSYKDKFADVANLTSLEAKILGLIENQKNISNETIAKVLKQDVGVIEPIVKDLTDSKIIKQKITKIGPDESLERTLAKPLSELVKKQPTTTTMMIRYTYAWRDIVPASERNTTEHPSRPFCVKMMELAQSKVWSASQIELISERLGYSVWDRLGGFWTMPDGTHSAQCRHEWKTLIVKKK